MIISTIGTKPIKKPKNNPINLSLFYTKNKYVLKDRDQNLLEATPDEMFDRLSSELARIEKKKFKNPLTKEEIYEYIKGFNRIVLQGSPMAGIGNNFQFVSISNCSILSLCTPGIKSG